MNSRRLGAVGLAVVCCATWGLTACRSASTNGSAPAVPSEPTFGRGFRQVPATMLGAKAERRMFERLNADRALGGLSLLTWDARLAEVARSHSAEMRDHKFFEHRSPSTGVVEDRLDAAGYLFAVVRENLAEGASVDSAQDRLLASEYHFDNLMAEDISHVGVGAVRGGVVGENNWMITQVFARPRTVPTAKEARNSLKRQVRGARSAHGVEVLQTDEELTAAAERELGQMTPVADEVALNALTRTLSGQELFARAGALEAVSWTVAELGEFDVPLRLARCTGCRFGVAARRVAGDRGRPEVQVLLLALYAASTRLER